MLLLVEVVRGQDWVQGGLELGPDILLHSYESKGTKSDTWHRGKRLSGA